MTNKKITTQPGDTWAKLAYLYLGAASSFRDLLDANPQLATTPGFAGPKPGMEINIPDDSIVKLSDRYRALDTIVTRAPSLIEQIFPFEEVGNYINALSRYHDAVLSIAGLEEANGPTLSSPDPNFVPEPLEDQGTAPVLIDWTAPFSLLPLR